MPGATLDEIHRNADIASQRQRFIAGLRQAYLAAVEAGDLVAMMTNAKQIIAAGGSLPSASPLGIAARSSRSRDLSAGESYRRASVRERAVVAAASFNLLSVASCIRFDGGDSAGLSESSPHTARLELLAALYEASNASDAEHRRAELATLTPLSDQTSILEAGISPAHRRFSMLVYAGGRLNVGAEMPAIVDLAGVSHSQITPIVLGGAGGGVENVLGQTDSLQVVPEGVRAFGAILAGTDAAQKIVALADKGFQWQANAAFEVAARQLVNAGESAAVNGKEFAGPLVVVRRARLRAISVVTIGAEDTATMVTVQRQGPGWRCGAC
jgi:hypothetical protein